MIKTNKKLPLKTILNYFCFGKKLFQPNKNRGKKSHTHKKKRKTLVLNYDMIVSLI